MDPLRFSRQDADAFLLVRVQVEIIVLQHPVLLFVEQLHRMGIGARRDDQLLSLHAAGNFGIQIPEILRHGEDHRAKNGAHAVLFHPVADIIGEQIGLRQRNFLQPYGGKSRYGQGDAVALVVGFQPVQNLGNIIVRRKRGIAAKIFSEYFYSRLHFISRIAKIAIKL